MYSTYLGGTGVDAGNAIAVDAAGQLILAGQTYSSDLPVANAFQATSGGGYDAFVAGCRPRARVLLLSYLGGNGSDTATAIAVEASCNVYLAGWTLSTNFPVLNGYQSVNAGSYGAFVAKLGEVARGAAGCRRSDAGFGQRHVADVQSFSSRIRRAPRISPAYRVLFNSSAEHRLGLLR